MKNRPTPWKVVEEKECCVIIDATGDLVCGGEICEGYIDPDIAAFIIKAVNAYDRYSKLIKRIAYSGESLNDFIGEARQIMEGKV